MAEKPAGWKDTCERFVAFLDIMGFKDRLQRDGHEAVGELLNSLRPTIKELEEDYKKIRNGEFISRIMPVYPVSFSDSIILISFNNQSDSAYSIVVYSIFLLSDAIERGIPMKGAIACGKMTADTDNSLFFGQPLIDAYNLQQELKLYGVVLHNTTQKHFKDLNKKENTDIKLIQDLLAIDYRVPMKPGKINHWLLDWTYYVENPESKVASLYNNISGAPRIYVDNTLEFVHWNEKRKAELKKKKTA